MNNKAVITGIGIVSSLGITHEDHVAAMRQVKSGLRASEVKNSTYNFGDIPDYNPADFIKNKKSIRFFSQQTIHGCSAAELAIRDAHLSLEEIGKNSQKNALIIGSGTTQGLRPMSEAIVSATNTDGVVDYEKLGTEGYRLLSPLWMLSRLPNTTAGQISIQNSIQGLNYSVVNGMNSGIVAIGEAFIAVKDKRVSRVVCGGVEDEIYADYVSKLRTECLVSESIDDSKPFCSNSKGILCSEGSSICIVEDEKEAQSRDANIYGEIIGYSNYYIPHLEKEKSGDDIARHFEKSMQKALQMAQISCGDIDFIQASACGNPNLDFAEALAIKNVFGKKPFITAAQPYIGNTLAASGAISVAFACLALQANIVAPLLYSNSLFFDSDLRYVKNNAIENENKICLVNAFSHLGEICSLIIRKR
jgi:3-oxoacyl-[acyl-carrier-protein] synthase II